MHHLRIFLVLCFYVFLISCASPRQSTRLTIDDLNEVTGRMTRSLGASRLLAERGPDSPRMVIVINKVENLTTDLIPPAEQWMLMARLRGAMPIGELSERKNIVFQVEPERWQLVRDAGFDGSLGETHRPTHVMSATVRSARREARSDREHGAVVAVTDYYLLQYELIDLHTRQIEWTDEFEFKRQARGVRID